ncbi:hypothetical protein [Streptomyces sp. NPDC007346]|uniref:hypothetical protein n=1 Tax=Streptomyces sp. NPDC007346 TaxID=3154682 RepID=UPI003452B0B7
MIRPVELVIFDCDGVLVDSERIAVRVDALALAQSGWKLTEAAIVDRFMGRSSQAMTKEIEAHLGHSLPADGEKEFEPHHLEGPGTVVFDDMRALPGLLAGR